MSATKPTSLGVPLTRPHGGASLLAMISVLGLAGFTFFADLASPYAPSSSKPLPLIFATAYFILMVVAMLMAKWLSWYEGGLIAGFVLFGGALVYCAFLTDKVASDWQGLLACFGLVLSALGTLFSLFVLGSSMTSSPPKRNPSNQPPGEPSVAKWRRSAHASILKP